MTQPIPTSAGTSVDPALARLVDELTAKAQLGEDMVGGRQLFQVTEDQHLAVAIGEAFERRPHLRPSLLALGPGTENAPISISR
jgi:hypothetical protein